MAATRSSSTASSQTPYVQRSRKFKTYYEGKAYKRGHDSKMGKSLNKSIDQWIEAKSITATAVAFENVNLAATCKSIWFPKPTVNLRKSDENN